MKTKYFMKSKMRILCRTFVLSEVNHAKIDIKYGSVDKNKTPGLKVKINTFEYYVIPKPKI